jgi:hypothetical protein
MIPDGDRRHDSESGGIVDQIEFLLVGHEDVMAEFVLGNHVLHPQWGLMARKPVQDLPDRALSGQIRVQAGEFSGFELCSIRDPDVIVRERGPEQRPKRNARQAPLKKPSQSSSYPLSQSTAMSLASERQRPTKMPPWSSVEIQGGCAEKIPAITDFRAKALSWARRA